MRFKNIYQLGKLFFEKRLEYKRDFTIIPFLFNKIVYVSTGKYKRRFKILPSMVGQKLGMFAFTKRMGFRIHVKVKKKKKKKK